MVSCTVGSPTITGWNRRSRAASFSMCLRYSSSVVAPMQCSSPRASIGLGVVPAALAPFGPPRAHDRVQLVDEEEDPPLGGDDLLEDGFQALLELAAVLRPRDQGAHVEREDRFVAEAFRHVAVHDPLREPFDDRRLAHTRIPDQNRVVLRLAREDLHDATDL